MKKSLLALTSILTASLTQVNLAQSTNDAIHHLQNKKFDLALDILNGDLNKLSTEDLSSDQLLLLRARALQFNKQPKKVIETIDQFNTLHPKSPLLSKALFLKAQALADLKRHAEASLIYQQQAEAIFSPTSKDAGAKLLIKLAQSFTVEPKNSETSSEASPRLDLNKADKLLLEAYDMDCSIKLKEQILAERIQINTKMSKWKAVATLCYTYLQEFDPSWQGEITSTKRIIKSPNSIQKPTDKKSIPGTHRFLIKYHLAEALHRNGNRPVATKYLNELISALKTINNPDQRALLADSIWLKLMASRKQGGTPNNIGDWIAQAEQYLKNYPDHIHASSTAYTIALIHQDADHYLPALKAFQNFIDNKHGVKIEQNSLTHRPETNTEFNLRHKKAITRKEESSYRIGQLHLENKKFDKAKTVWLETSKMYPNGARWADCQKGLVSIDAMRALHQVTAIEKAESTTDKIAARVNAQAALNNFISTYPLDNRVPSLLFLTGNIHYIHANQTAQDIKKLSSSPKNKEQLEKLKEIQSTALKNTILQWEQLITKYPSSTFARDAQYTIATIYENYTGELEKAIALYKKSNHANAQNKLITLNSKKLTAFSNKSFTTDEKPFIKLNTRNIENLTVKQYWLDIESYFRKGRKLEDIDSLDIDLVEADKTWEYKIPNYKKLHLIETELEIPFQQSKPGICIIKIESKDYTTTTMVVRSDIDVALRSGGFENNELITYAYNARLKKPANKVEILITDAGKVITSGTTNDQGILHINDKKLSDIKDLRILALSPKGAATCDSKKASNHLLPRIEGSPNSIAKLFFNRAKHSYSPGEVLPISGIIRHYNKGNFIAPSAHQRDYTLTITHQNKLLYKTDITLEERGMFSHHYTLPEGLTQNITLELNSKANSTNNVSTAPNIQSFYRNIYIKKQTTPETNIILTLDNTWVKKNQPVTGKIKAAYSWGAPYANQKVILLLPDQETKISLITNDTGTATFTYTPTDIRKSTSLSFQASFPNSKGNSDQKQVLYDPAPFTILASSEYLSIPSGSSTNIEIKTLDPAANPISKALTLKVTRIIKVKADPVLSSVQSMENFSKEFYKEEVVQNIPLTTPETGSISHRLKIDTAGTYEIRITSADPITKDKAIAKSSITVYDSSSFNNLASLKIQPLKASQVGQSALLNIWSSSKQHVSALLTVETGSIIEKRIIKLHPGNNSHQLNLDTRHCPDARVHILALSERILLSDEQLITVTNPLTIKSEFIKRDPNNPYLHTLKLQARDNNNKAIASDIFINITNLSKQQSHVITNRFKRNTLVRYNNTSNTGLNHQGQQKAKLTSVTNELNRLLNAESNEIQRLNTNDIVSRHQSTSKVKRHLYRANSYYNQSQFDNALEEYQEVLRIDPYNRAARQGMEQVNAKKTNYYRAAYDSTRTALLQEVDRAWELGALPNSPGTNRSYSNADFTPRQNNFTIPQGILEEFTTNNQFSTNGRVVISPTEKAEYDVLPAQTKLIRIPASGREITINTKFLEKSTGHHFQIIGISDQNATGQTNLTTKITPPKQPKASSKIISKGIPLSNLTNHQLEAGKSSFQLTLPASATPESITLAISSSTSELLHTAATSELISTFGSATPLHESHPAGQLMAHCAHYNYLAHHKLDIPLQKQLTLEINRLSSELTICQKSDGSWAAIKNRRLSSLTHTAIAYQALNMAKEIDITIEESTLSSTQNWLLAQQKSISTELYNYRALIQYALASSEDSDFAICNRLFREREKMDNVGKAILANTFILIDRKEFANTLINETTNNSTVSKPQELPLNSPILLNSLILQAKLALNGPENITLEPTLIFRSDNERGIASRAYANYCKLVQPTSHKLPNKEITVNGTTLTINNPVGEISIPKKHLQAGINTITTNYKQSANVTAIISGYTSEKTQTQQSDFTIKNRKYYHKNLIYKGTPLASQSTSEVSSIELGETVRVSLEGKISNKHHAHSLLIESIPTGFTYLAGSLRGNHSGARLENDHLVITYSSNPATYKISYTLIAATAGTSYHRPTILSPYYETNKKTYNKSHQLIITSDKSNIPHKTNAAEHYELAKLHFENLEYKAAKQHIIAYNKLKQTSEDPALAQMLLWIETANPSPDAQQLADSFEILTERKPELIIPFEKILKVGKAYRQIKEFERSSDVYTATLEANFATESYVGAVLEDQSEFSLSLDYQDKIWRKYPDIGDITTSRFELGQQIYTIATDKQKSLTLGKNPATKKPYTEVELTQIALNYMEQFLTLAPDHKQSADASFSIANALFALKKYQEVINHTTTAAVTHKKSNYATNFRYMQAVGHFWLRNYDKALKAASSVANENSDDRDLAAFITAQIYHAKDQPEDAIKWYNKIKGQYPDAVESIAYFEEKSISLDEVKVLDSGEKATLDIKFRNIKEAQFQIYRVDLMQLYLREKNLSNISQINLAGINPKHSLTVKLGDGKNYKEIEKQIQLPITADGAYLVICRGDYLYTSGLVLITPLKMDVQESPASQSVRVNISDKQSGNYLDSVHVKAVGNGEEDIISGDTDLRGIWQGNNISSPSTIIAKDKKGRYAFFRSKLPKDLKQTELPNSSLPNPSSIDFNSNLNILQNEINIENSWKFEQKRRSKGKGVEINKARKK